MRQRGSCPSTYATPIWFPPSTADARRRQQASQVYPASSRKYFWFWKPMQLLIQGQWWSYRSTHLLHRMQ